MQISAREEAEGATRVIYTYRYLRISMVALMLMFGAVPFTQLATSPCLLGSISGYFYTPARTLFVGSLFGLGACLLAYQGHSDEEDVLLNFTGIMAFIVAIVPTEVEHKCTFVPNEAAHDSTGVAANLWTLVIIGLLGACAILVLRHVAQAKPLSRAARFLVGASGLILVLEMGFFILYFDQFVRYMHGIAAATMVVGVSGVMLVQAFRRPRPAAAAERSEPEMSNLWSRARLQIETVKARRSRERWNWAAISYVVIAVGLILALAWALIISMVTNFNGFIIQCEWIVVILFCAYWVVQTVELWRASDQNEGLLNTDTASPDQVQSAPASGDDNASGGALSGSNIGVVAGATGLKIESVGSPEGRQAGSVVD
jgi:hypothetical protein